MHELIDGETDQWTDIAMCRVACPRLKMWRNLVKMETTKRMKSTDSGVLDAKIVSFYKFSF